jgi:hypothetical protein
MKTEKIYQVAYDSRNGDERVVTGTLTELVKHFGYTLEVGASYNAKINTNPKTIASFINHYNKAVDEQYGGYYRPYLRMK